MLCQTAAPAPPPRALSQLTRRASASARVRRVAPSRALGFDLGEAAADKLRPEAEAQALVEDAASLLFAQDALRGPAAQAYLALLQQIALKASPTRLFTAYGAFFRAQQATGARTFADHVVDEVIAGKGNPLAETCARGAREPSALELAAVRADMDLLQRLCVSEATVLGWCERLAERDAAAQAAGVLARRRRGARRRFLLGGGERRGFTSGRRRGHGRQRHGRRRRLGRFQERHATRHPGRPAAPVDARRAPRRDRRELGLERRAAGAGQALGALRRGRGGREERFAVDGPQDQAPGFLWGRGRGRRAHRAVRRRRRRGHAPRACRRGHGVDGFVEDAFASRPGAAAARAAIVEELASASPRHVLVHGPPGVGKRFAARSAIGAGFERGARCVRLGRGDLRALPEILAEAAAHPRASFVLFLEMPLCLTPYAEFHNELTAALDGGGGGGAWPANATLVATALAPTGLKPGERDEGASLAGRFGRVVAMEAEE